MSKTTFDDHGTSKNEHVSQQDGGVYIRGNVSESHVVGRDFIQNVYSYLPVPDVVKKNATKITTIYAAIIEFLAILGTISDVKAIQQERFPAYLRPPGIKPPLPQFSEIIGIFFQNNILFFGLGVLLALGIIVAFWYMQKQKDEI